MRRYCYVLTLGLIVAMIYFAIGGYSGLRAYYALQAFNHDPARGAYEHLQHTLNQHIARTEDPLSELLQARLYFADKAYAQSVIGFEKAYHALEQDVGVLVEYATALYFAHPQDPRLPPLLLTLRDADPMPIAGYSLLANIAMDAGDKAAAKRYWQALLAELPKDSSQRSYVEQLLKGL